MSAFQCAHPRHEGPRLITAPTARYQARVEWRRADAQDRPHAKAFMDVCGRCMNTYQWPAIERLSEYELASFFVKLEYAAPPAAEQKGML